MGAAAAVLVELVGAGVDELLLAVEEELAVEELSLADEDEVLLVALVVVMLVLVVVGPVLEADEGDEADEADEEPETELMVPVLVPDFEAHMSVGVGNQGAWSVKRRVIPGRWSSSSSRCYRRSWWWSRPDR